MLFPEGEQFFVKSVANYRTQIKDEILKNQVSGFIGQEAHHTQAHIKFNNMLRDAGYPVDYIDKVLKSNLGFITKYHPLIALHITAILEHYTATLGGQLIVDKRHNQSITKESRKLWIHHAIEEVEHREVSFDVLDMVDDQITPNRIVLFPIVSVGFAAAVAVLFAYNLKTQKVSFKELRSLGRLIKLLGKNSGKMLDWFDPGFHPSMHQYDVSKMKSEIGI
jgi:predicted metal-dependent hydrolase